MPSVTNTASVAGGGEAAANNGNNSDSDPTTVIAANGPPVVDAGGPYTGAEGSAIALSSASATDPDAGDTPTYKWTYVANGAVDAGTTCSFSNDAIVQPSFTCNDDGAFTLTLTVNDGHGHVVADDAAVTVTNVKPTATAGGPYTGDEGSAIQLAGTGDDPAANDDDPKLTYKWTVTTTGIDAGGACTSTTTPRRTPRSPAPTTAPSVSAWSPPTTTAPPATPATAALTVANVKPVADAGGPYTGDEGTAILLGGSATDVGANDTRTYKWTADVTGIDAGGACTFDDDTKTDAKVTCTDDGGLQGHARRHRRRRGREHRGRGDAHRGQRRPGGRCRRPLRRERGRGHPAQRLGDRRRQQRHPYLVVGIRVRTGLDAGATCSFTSATAEDPKITCTDDGEVKLTLTVKDDNGGTGVDEATLTLANVPPVAHAGGPYTGERARPFRSQAPPPTSAANDVISYKWTANTSGSTPAAPAPSTTPPKKNAKITCTDDGTVELTLKATDDDGGISMPTRPTLTVANAAPVANAGGPYTGNEGSPVRSTARPPTRAATIPTPGPGSTWREPAWTRARPAASATHAPNPTITCTDDGEVKLTLTVDDDDGGERTTRPSSPWPTSLRRRTPVGRTPATRARPSSSTAPPPIRRERRHYLQVDRRRLRARRRRPAARSTTPPRRTPRSTAPTTAPSP